MLPWFYFRKYRFKLNTLSIQGKEFDRNPEKPHGGCLRHCKNNAKTQGLDVICAWRGCSGCEACVGDKDYTLEANDDSTYSSITKRIDHQKGDNERAIDTDSGGTRKYKVPTANNRPEGREDDDYTSAQMNVHDESVRKETQNDLIKFNFKRKKHEKECSLFLRDDDTNYKFKCGCAGPYLCNPGQCESAADNYKMCLGCEGCL